MGGVSQPEDGLGVELMDALAADTEGATNGGQGQGRVAVETVMGDDDVSKAGRELCDEVAQGSVDQGVVKGADVVGSGVGRNIDAGRARETVLKIDRPPDGVGNGRDGVGAEGGTSLRVVVSERGPEADAPLMEGMVEGQVAQPLAPYNPMDERFVLGHLLGQDAVPPISVDGGILGHSGASFR